MTGDAAPMRLRHAGGQRRARAGRAARGWQRCAGAGGKDSFASQRGRGPEGDRCGKRDYEWGCTSGKRNPFFRPHTHHWKGVTPASEVAACAKTRSQFSDESRNAVGLVKGLFFRAWRVAGGSLIFQWREAFAGK